MILILMGVTGSGKTTIGQLLARQLGWTFADADDFHPPANVEKIRKGIALDDADRAPWLNAVADAERTWLRESSPVILACSALKKVYRHQLQVAPEVRFVYLKGDPELIRNRVAARQGHFATTTLLDSQFATLEEPGADDGVTVVDVSGTPDRIAAEVRAQLGLA
jgi:gluconokinase